MNRDDATQLVLAQSDHGALWELPAGANEGAKFVGVGGLGKQIEDFGATSSLGVPKKAGGQNTAPVHHQQITLSQMIGQREELTVSEISRGSIEEQKPRGVSIRKRDLRYEIWRQFEVEVLGLQKSFF